MALQSYIDRRDKEIDKRAAALFLTAKGLCMTSAQVRYIVRQNLAKVSTLKKKSPHVLRHTLRHRNAESRSRIRECEETTWTRESLYYGDLHSYNVRAVEESL